MSEAPETVAAGVDPRAWAGRRVLVTGHTGFKGAWLTLWLLRMGAHVTGFADGTPTNPSLHALADVGSEVDEKPGDVRDAVRVADVIADVRPEVVIHMAAQPMVRRSFVDPLETYATNVMGTAHVLEAVRTVGRDHVRAVINVTSDKCYDNREQGRPFVEGDPMGGHDPYSNSKGCAELVADAYRRSFFDGDGPRLASVRAGNVIGGGDWGAERLVPDIMRAAETGAPIAIRNPEAVRPWQHVLNPLSGYLVVAERLLAGDASAADGWNFGPASGDVRPVRWITDRIAELWPTPLTWDVAPGPHPHEAHYLALDSTRARERLGWAPRWDLARTLEAIVGWYAAHLDGEPMRERTLQQIEEFTHA